MRDAFPFLKVLTIPTDAGPTDDRVVIDGNEGTITGYQGTDVIWHLDVNSPTRGIWSLDFASSTSQTDMEAVGHVRIINENINLSEGGPADSDATIRASNLGGLVLQGYVQDPGDPSKITLSCTELAMTTTGSGSGTGSGPIITVSGNTDGLGGITFNHGAPSTPRLILPIMENPVGERVNAIDAIGATTATAWTSTASSAVTFRALVVT